MTETAKPRLAFVGAITVDAIALLEGFPAPDSRQVAEELVTAGGGPAATAAVTAARLGAEVALFGAVGDDTEGRRALADLEAEGVDTAGVRILPEGRTGASVILVDAARGTRCIATRSMPAPVAGPELDELGNAQWVHADHLGWEAAHRLLSAEGPRPRLSVDGGNPIPGFSAAGVDLYVPTLQELSNRFGPGDREELLRRARAEGAREVVATDGAAGSVMLTADGLLHEAPAHPVAALSTLGAGDVFHGALLVAVASGRHPSEALRYANIAAALSCRGLDGRSAIPTDQEIRSVLATADPSATPINQEAR